MVPAVPDPARRHSNRPAVAIVVAALAVTAASPAAVVLVGGTSGCDDGIDCHERAVQATSTALSPDNDAQSANFLAAACERGHSASCTQLAARYHTADGVAFRPDRAKALFRRACESDAGVSCLTLAEMLTQGSPSSKRIEEALGVLTRACSGGNADACDRAASIYEHGDLVTADTALAVVYRQRACELDEDACPALQRACERSSVPRCLLEERRSPAAETPM